MPLPFWKNKREDKIIQCSICEWNPDGRAYWQCSCGHFWNTFDTKGQCPKCKIQWKDTRCPGCGTSTPHKNWYKTKEEIEQIEHLGDLVLRAKKKSIESRLIKYGIKNRRIAYLPYLDHTNLVFQSTYDTACRMMILYAIGYLVHNLNDKDRIKRWLKDENIWEKVSENEKKFFNDNSPSEELIMDLSWRIESALTLAWCLKKVDKLPLLDCDNNDKELDEFQANIPELGESLKSFLSNLEYRSKEEIYEENLLNEMATAYFRDLMFSGKEDETKINRRISFERHIALNWLRKFMEVSDWDETDTST